MDVKKEHKVFYERDEKEMHISISEAKKINKKPRRNRKDSKRADRKKNTVKVAKSLLENPIQTERELAKDTGLSKTGARRIKKELDQVGPKDPLISEICKEDVEIVKLAQAKMKKIIKTMDTSDETEKVKARDLSSIAKESAARYQIFMGDVTDDKGGLKVNIDNLYDEKE